MKPVFSSRVEYGASPQPVQIDKFQKPSVVHTISRTLYISYYFRIHTRSLLQNHLKNLDKLLSSDRLLLKVIREFFHQIIINVLHTISRTLNKYFHGPIKIHVNEFQISGTMPRSYYFKSHN
jgi:hypothetical protein